jgi:hypothetical protein
MTATGAGRAEALLVVARAQGDFRVHLSTVAGREALCGQAVRPRPVTKSLREAGCPGCLMAALDAGHVAAMEGDRSWINLRRLHLVAG